MSDQQTLTSASASSQNVTPAAPQQTVPPATSASQVDKPAGTPDKPINLHQLEEFRRVQSQYERQKAELQRRLEAEQEARKQAELRGLDEYEQQVKLAQLENQQLKEQLDAIRMEKEMMAAEQARRDYLVAVSKKTGAPLEALEPAQGPDEVWGLAWDYVQRRMSQQPQSTQLPEAPPVSWEQAQRQMEAKAEQAFVPDLGGGASSAPSNAEQMLADAQRLNNPVLYLQALRKLREEGKA